MPTGSISIHWLFDPTHNFKIGARVEMDHQAVLEASLSADLLSTLLAQAGATAELAVAIQVGMDIIRAADAGNGVDIDYIVIGNVIVPHPR